MSRKHFLMVIHENLLKKHFFFKRVSNPFFRNLFMESATRHINIFHPLLVQIVYCETKSPVSAFFAQYVTCAAGSLYFRNPDNSEYLNGTERLSTQNLLFSSADRTVTHVIFMVSLAFFCDFLHVTALLASFSLPLPQSWRCC